MVNRVCIVGGGNIGMALAVEINKNIKAEIVLLTSKRNIFNETIVSTDTVKNISTSSRLTLVTDDYAEALSDAELIFVTNPAFCVHNVVANINLIRKATIILVPGSGGREFHFRKFADQGHIVAGLDRVPFIARIADSGKTVVASKKPKIRFASLKREDNFYIERLLSECLDIQSLPINNYLNVVFTPSNQILHTSRLYALLYGKSRHDYFSRQIKFYAEWDDISSDYLLAADNELQNVCKAYKLSEVMPLTTHYESENTQKMTQKLRNIKSLSNIDSPFIFTGNKYTVDGGSRYFQEDFPYGLCIVKDFAVIANINTPFIDTILKWYSSFFSLNYFVNSDFSGKDLKHLSLPRNFGMNSMNDVANYYQST